MSASRNRDRLPVPSAATKLERAARKTGSLTEFKPNQTRMKLGALKEGIKLATTIKDWAALEAAIDGIIDEQRAFLAWWDANVSNRGGDRQTQKGKALSSRGDNGLSVKNAIAETGVTKQQVSKWRGRLQDREAYRQTLRQRAYPEMWALRNGVHTVGAGSNEWYTPAEYIERARRVLGAIDLDPASSDQAQAIIKAMQYFTANDDGRIKEWRGRVWLHPPRTRPLILDFVQKMLAERRAARVTAAIMLTPNNTETGWFQEAAASADAICFTKGPIRLVDPDGAAAAPTLGQAFFYFGGDLECYESTFSDVGIIVLPNRRAAS